MNALKIARLAIAITAITACMPPAKTPSVKEPIDSVKWKKCAKELARREATALIDDLTLDSKTLLCQGVWAASQGKIDKAQALLTEASVEDEKDYRPHYMLGKVLAEAGRYEEALTAFKQSRKRYNKISIPSEAIGRQILDKEGRSSAISFLKKANRRKVCPYDCRGLLAKLYHEDQKSDEAKTVYRQMIRDNPEEPTAHVGLASLANAQKDYKLAVRNLQNATDTDNFSKLAKEQRADILYSLAFAQFNEGDYPAASKSLDDALILNSNRADWFLLAGWIDLKQDHSTQAIVNFERAQKLDPKLAPATIGIGDAEMMLQDHKAAATTYEKALQLDPKNGIYMIKHALALIKSGDLETGKTVFENALEVGGNGLPQELVNEVAALIPKDTANSQTSDTSTESNPQ